MLALLKEFRNFVAQRLIPALFGGFQLYNIYEPFLVNVLHWLLWICLFVFPFILNEEANQQVSRYTYCVLTFLFFTLLKLTNFGLQQAFDLSLKFKEISTTASDVENKAEDANSPKAEIESKSEENAMESPSIANNPDDDPTTRSKNDTTQAQIGERDSQVSSNITSTSKDVFAPTERTEDDALTHLSTDDAAPTHVTHTEMNFSDDENEEETAAKKNETSAINNSDTAQQPTDTGVESSSAPAVASTESNDVQDASLLFDPRAYGFDPTTAANPTNVFTFIDEFGEVVTYTIPTDVVTTPSSPEVQAAVADHVTYDDDDHVEDDEKLPPPEDPSSLATPAKSNIVFVPLSSIGWLFQRLRWFDASVVDVALSISDTSQSHASTSNKASVAQTGQMVKLNIPVSRLWLLALFDRDVSLLVSVIHVIVATVIAALAVELRPIFVDQFGGFGGPCALWFMVAATLFSLVKSPQPDAPSIRADYQTVNAFNRPVYFIFFSLCIFLFDFLQEEYQTHDSFQIYGITTSTSSFCRFWRNAFVILLAWFPLIWAYGLFPQCTTLGIYVVEQLNILLFYSTGSTSYLAAQIEFFRCLAYTLLGGLLLWASKGIRYTESIDGIGGDERSFPKHLAASVILALLMSQAYLLARMPTQLSLYVEPMANALPYWMCAKPVLYVQRFWKEVVEGQTRDIPPNEPIPSIKEQLQQLAADSCYPSGRFRRDFFVSLLVFIVSLTVLLSTLIHYCTSSTFYYVVGSLSASLGLCSQYLVPTLRKARPFKIFKGPFLVCNELTAFEPKNAPNVYMTFEQVVLVCGVMERYVMYPLWLLSLTAQSGPFLVLKWGLAPASVILSLCFLKTFRGIFGDKSRFYLFTIFAMLFFGEDLRYTESRLVDFAVGMILVEKLLELLNKINFVLIYMAPWGLSWGSDLHVFMQPLSIPHSANTLFQIALSTFLSSPLYPLVGGTWFIAGYGRATKYWERGYSDSESTKLHDQTQTKLSLALEGWESETHTNDLNRVFYEHMKICLQECLLEQIEAGRLGNVSTGDILLLANDRLTALLHIVSLGSGYCTFQLRGMEWKGTMCQEAELQEINEIDFVNHEDTWRARLPPLLRQRTTKSSNAQQKHQQHQNQQKKKGELAIPNRLDTMKLLSQQWLSWEVTNTALMLKTYSVALNPAKHNFSGWTMKSLYSYYFVSCTIYYLSRSDSLTSWLNEPRILQHLLTIDEGYCDRDTVFNHRHDRDYDMQAGGISVKKFYETYGQWIAYCVKHRVKQHRDSKEEVSPPQQYDQAEGLKSSSRKAKKKQRSDSISDQHLNPGKEEVDIDEDVPTSHSISPLSEADSSMGAPFFNLCYCLSLLGRRCWLQNGSTAYLSRLHSVFKGDLRINSFKDEWILASIEMMEMIVGKSVKMGLCMHQDYFIMQTDYQDDPEGLFESIEEYDRDLIICHESDKQWREAIINNAPQLLSLRESQETYRTRSMAEYFVVSVSLRYSKFRVVKLNREIVRGLWAGQQHQLVFLGTMDPERGSIQNLKTVLRNLVNQSCDEPIGYPSFKSDLVTSFGSASPKAFDNIVQLLPSYIASPLRWLGQ